MEVDDYAKNIHLTFEVQTLGKAKKPNPNTFFLGVGVLEVWFFVLFSQTGLGTDVKQ